MDVGLCERFGWTFTELDEQDMARVLPAVGASNVAAALRNVNAYLDSNGRMKPTAHDMTMYQIAKDAKDNNLQKK